MIVRTSRVAARSTFRAGFTLMELLVVVALLVVLAGTGGVIYMNYLEGAKEDVAKSQVQVLIQDYAFKAPTITVSSGTEVDWTNKDDDPHTVTADDASFDSKGLDQGDVYRHVFLKPGKYPYHCAAHPFMKGVVVVTGGKVK